MEVQLESKLKMSLTLTLSQGERESLCTPTYPSPMGRGLRGGVKEE
jgi:hypothetical protein